MALQVTINGRDLPIGGVPTHTTVLDFLREQGLTGCKEGCAEGECGACAVLVARPGVLTSTEWVALNACLLPIAALDGQEIVTAEGLGAPGALHPVQQEMAVRGGSQCGYCTPGFVCSMAAEYYRADRTANGHGGDGAASDGATGHGGDEAASDGATGHGGDGAAGDGSGGADPGHADPEHGPNGFDLHALSGNLCRCTGYRPIRDAAYAVGAPAADDAFARRRNEPPRAPAATDITVGGLSFTRPATLAEATALLREHPDATVVAGCTDWGVEVNLRGARAGRVVAVDALPELRTLTEAADHVEIGAAVTLSEIERRLSGRVPLLAELFPQFASRLIRNGATLGGNLGTGSPIGDSAPVLLALDASLTLADADGEREVALADYFTGYRASVRRPGELIRSVRIPLPLAPVTAFYKIAKRRFDDISSVAAAFALTVVDGTVRTARIGLGGVAATPIRAQQTEQALVGRPWTRATVQAAADVLRAEGTPIDDQRATAKYRAEMLRQTLRKLYAASTTPLEVGA